MLSIQSVNQPVTWIVDDPELVEQLQLKKIELATAFKQAGGQTHLRGHCQHMGEMSDLRSSFI